VYVLRLEEAGREGSLRVVFANRASERMLGLAPSAIVGGLLAEHFPLVLRPDGPARAYHDVIVTQSPRDLGVVAYGDERVAMSRFGVSAFPLADDEVAVLFENLSAPPANATELAAIVDSAEDAILSKDIAGTILTWNASAERMYGYSAAEAVGQPISMLLPPDRPEEVTEIMQLLLRGERIDHLVTRRIRKDGVLIDVSLTVSPIKDAHGAVIGAATIARDITRQNEAESGAQQLAAIVEASEDAIFSRTLEGRLISWNAGAEKLFGYNRAEVIGRSSDLLLFEEPTPQIATIRERLNRGEHQKPIEMLMRRKDGSEVFVSSSAAPIVDKRGSVVGVAAVVRDVTEQRRLEEQLRQTQKLEAIGSLAGGIAHDFNNVLTVIRSATETVMSELTEGPISRRVAQIALAAEHATALTRQLLAFSRQQVLRPEPTDINVVVEATLGLVEGLIGEQITLERHFGSDVATISIDRGQLQQVIVNLCVNARDAMPDGGTLTIATKNVELGEPHTSEHVNVTGGMYASLEITDTGVGMEADTRERIFDPFFTTKPEGTGLGLATVYGIVKQSGGHVWVYSEPQIGSTFKIYFPATEGEVGVVAAEGTPGAALALTGDETILLVEDAEMLRPLVVEMLEAHGYRVLTAANGAEALAIATRHDGRIDLLLTDIVMPGMNGRELSEQLFARRPELRVLFTSGYPADTVIRHGIAQARVAFIQKPYVGAELLAKIRETLAAASGI
jgi:PAS domain S-box-containing protein